MWLLLSLSPSNIDHLLEYPTKRIRAHQMNQAYAPPALLRMDPKSQLRVALTQRQAEEKRLTTTLAILTEQLNWTAFKVKSLTDRINEWGMHFLGFPQDIHLMIYKELLPSVLYFPFFRSSGLQLLDSCRQVRAEFLPTIRTLPTAVVRLHDPCAVKAFLRWIESKTKFPPACLTRLVIEVKIPRIGYNHEDVALNLLDAMASGRNCPSTMRPGTSKSSLAEVLVRIIANSLTYSGIYRNHWDRTSGSHCVEWNLPTEVNELTTSWFGFHGIDTILSVLGECTSTDYVTNLGNDAFPANYLYTGSPALDHLVYPG